MILPPLPPNTPYTNCYCEENIYLLAQAFFNNTKISESWEIFVVFISNQSRSVALWNQKSALELDLAVVWDYHVVLLLRPRGPSDLQSQRGMTVSMSANEPSKSWIYDFDTRLPLPCVLEDYMFKTFLDVPVPPRYESLFRIIPGDVFLRQFASDRSHMLVAKNGEAQANDPCTDKVYMSPPPSYEPIRGTSAVEKGVVNNLMSSFVDIGPSEQTFGHVIDRATMNTEMWT